MSASKQSSLSRFIVIEGIDGSGSTTQAKRLVAHLTEVGKPAVCTCEPSQGVVGQLIRRVLSRRLDDAGGEPVTLDWRTLALLFAADRADHVNSTIAPALARGCWVVSDRYDLSSLAYQSATSGGCKDVLPWIRQLNSQVLRPDLTIVVDVTATTAERRRQRRGREAELFEVPSLQQRLADIYAHAERLVPEDRLVHVDGEADIEPVADAIWSVVQA